MNEKNDDATGTTGGEANPPAEKADAAKPTATAKKKHPRRPAGHGRRTRGGRGLWLGILVLNLLLVFGGVYLWKQQLAASEEARERINRLRDDQQRLARALDDARRQLDERLAGLRSTQKRLHDDLAALLERSGHLRNDWMIAEAEYLIRLANHRLLLDRDIDTALAALASADERLRDTGDPALIPARKALAEDMAALRALPRVDRTGLSLQLSALASRAGTLPLATPAPERQAEPAATPADGAPADAAAPAEEDRPWWESLTGAWEILRGLIVIRQHEDPVQPLIPPEQRFFLTQNLVLQLEEARIALLRGEADIYRERVLQAHDWVRRFFDARDPAVAEALARLKALADEDIAPPLPEITRGLAAIARYRTRQAGTPEAPPAPKPAPQPAPAAAPATPAPAEGGGS